MSASDPFDDDMRVSLEIAAQECDDTKDLNLQREKIGRLNTLLIEAGNAGIDISYYLSCYIKWIAQATIQTEYLYMAKIYIAHAAELLQYVKDIEIRESHEDVFLELSLQLDEKIKSNIKEWIGEALRAINNEEFDAVEILLKQVVDNLKFIEDSSEREINAAALSHCYSILISHKIEKAEDFIVNNDFGAAKKQREEAQNFLKYIKDEEIKIFHEDRLRDPQQEITEPLSESSSLSQNTIGIAVFENKGMPKSSVTSLSSLSFARLSQFFIDTFDLEAEGSPGDTPSPRIR